MEKNINEVEIRLSRIPLFLIFCICLFFVFVGLELGFFHIIIKDFSVESDKLIVFYLFEFFMVVCGGVAVLQMVWYLVVPPVMFRADEKGVSFATGFRYKPYTIDRKYVENIGVGMNLLDTITTKNPKIGLQVNFVKSPDIPSVKATSIGVSYFNYCLTLSWIYMNQKNMKELKQKLEKLKLEYLKLV